LVSSVADGELARKVISTIECVEQRCMAADGPVTPTCKEITDAELRAIYLMALNVLKDPPREAPGRMPLPALQQRVKELAEHHGSIRAAARVLMVDHTYLYRLSTGEKDDPGDDLLRKLKLRRVVTFERTDNAAPGAP
jgi:hypothetical protein